MPLTIPVDCAVWHRDRDAINNAPVSHVNRPFNRRTMFLLKIQGLVYPFSVDPTGSTGGYRVQCLTGPDRAFIAG
jgi:hypothetical protein